MTTLGDRIRNLRISNELIQGDLAEQMMVTKQAVSNWERNVTSPDHRQLCYLADLFKVSVDYLLLRTDLPKPYYMSSIEGDFSLSSTANNESDPEYSYDLKRILLTPNTQLHFGQYTLSIKDRKLLAEIIDKISERVHELNPN